jgi:hypothetical protein
MLVGLWRGKWIYTLGPSLGCELEPAAQPKTGNWPGELAESAIGPGLDAQHLGVWEGGLLYGDWLGLDVPGIEALLYLSPWVSMRGL